MFAMLHNENETATFKHFDLELFKPDFGSTLVDLIIELNFLRKKQLSGTTHVLVFLQLKHIFHMLESIGSARIEGNNTTVLEYIETKIDKAPRTEDSIEIENTEKALSFVDENVPHAPIDKLFVSELHKIVVSGLTKEGSKRPGEYRKIKAEITHSKHLPPDFNQVDSYMQELFDFIAHADAEKYDLLKTAIAHHRFTWIHPFDNGNGRTVRLLTYAMLVKQGFQVSAGEHLGRILNPTAVFCNDRNIYYDALAWADSGTQGGVLRWCEYVLSGLKTEIEKIDKITDYEYLSAQILLPAISMAKKRENITELEEKVLKIAVNKQVFKSSDIEHLMPGKIYTERSRVLRNLRDKKMIMPITKDSRKYILRFDNNYLLRSIIEILDINGFLPVCD